MQTFLKKWQEESGGKLKYALVKRDSLSEKDLDGVDLVVALGGDGTTLIASHWISSSLSLSSSSSSRNDGGDAKSSSLASDRPKLIGINTDPAVLAPCLTFTKKAEDERRSTGWLCAADANDVEDVLKEILFASSEDNNNSSNECSDSNNDDDNKESSRNSSGVNSLIKRRPIRANRIRIKVNGKTWKTMPLALNDVLICHNSPAALSRYSVLLEEDDLVNTPPKHSDDDDEKNDEDGNKKKKFEAYYHIRSSGLRLCTALGATRGDEIRRRFRHVPRRRPHPIPRPRTDILRPRTKPSRSRSRLLPSEQNDQVSLEHASWKNLRRRRARLPPH